MKTNATKLVPYLIGALVTGLVCAIHLYERTHPSFAATRKLEWITYDARVRYASGVDTPVAGNLGAVFLDDDAVATINREFQIMPPWPRQFHARLVHELKAQGARSIGFDIFFAEVDPNILVKVNPTSNENIPADDYFADEMRNAGNVVLAAAEGLLPAPLFQTNALMIGNANARSDIDGVLRRAKPYDDFKNWHPILRKVADEYTIFLNKAEIKNGVLHLPRKGGEVIEVPLDEKGRFDYTELLGSDPPPGMPVRNMPFEVVRVWHLGIVLAAQELGLDLTNPIITKDSLTLRGAKDVQRVIPLDEEGMFNIDWQLKWNDEKLAKHSFTKVLDWGVERSKGKAVNPPPFAGKIVVVGSTATGNNLTDKGATPLSQDTFLVSKHWNIANSIMTGRFVKKTASGGELLIILVLGMTSAWMTWRLRAPWPTVWVLVAAGVYVALAFYAYVHFRYWLPIFIPVVGAMFMNHLGVETYRVVFEQKEKRRVKSVFAKLVSPNVVDEMLKSEQLNLGGTRRMITVFFADVRGFTSMTDEYAAKAEEYVRTHKLDEEAAEAYRNEQAAITLETVNMYLSTIADKVKEHKGTLDKYMGDCVMAFWGMPTPNPQHALSCVRAAVDAQRAMSALNQKRADANKVIEAENLERIKRGEEPRQLNTLLALGTGINTGHAIIGLMGSERHILNYTVFGREVNIASRLEGVSGRGRIIIGEATYAEILRDDPTLAATCMELEPVMVKGIKKPVRIFEVPWKQEKEKLPEQTTDAATGFFRLESKDTVVMPKPVEKPETPSTDESKPT